MIVVGPGPRAADRADRDSRRSRCRSRWSLLAAAGLFEAPFEAARGALLPDVLPGERYPAGYALSQILVQAAQVGGFGLAGVLLIGLSPSVLLILDAATFVAVGDRSSRATCGRDRPPPQRPAKRTPGAGGRTPWATLRLAVRPRAAARAGCARWRCWPGRRRPSSSASKRWARRLPARPDSRPGPSASCSPRSRSAVI